MIQRNPKIFTIVLASLALGACGEEANSQDQADYGANYTDGQAYDPATYSGNADFAPLEPNNSNQPDLPRRDIQLAQYDRRGGAPQGQPGAAQQPMQAPGMTRLQIPDMRGFEKPMVAYSVLAPNGWKSQGGVMWTANMARQGCGPNIPYTNWTATAPDGVGMVSFLPDETWSYFEAAMQMPGMPQQCPIKPMEIRAFVADYAQRMRPGARMLDFKDFSNEPEVRQLDQQIKSMSQSYPGMDVRAWVQAGQALIAYQVNGVEVREIIGTGVIFNETRMGGMMPGDETRITSIMALPGFAMRMPAGQLDFALADKIRESVVANPEWEKKMAAYRAKNAEIQADGARKTAAINAKGARDRSAIISQTYSEISDMQMDSWRKQQASGDYIQRETTEAIGGYETYNDPYNGGTVQLDNTYDQAWQLNDGTNVMTNDAFFDPYAATGQDGQQLEVTE